MNNELEEYEQQNEKKRKHIKEGFIKLKLIIVVMVFFWFGFISLFFILNEMFANHKTFFNSINSLIDYVKINWWKSILKYGSIILIGGIATILHIKILKKKGGIYNTLSVFAAISIIYLGFAIFFQSIDSLKLMYNENFKLWCFTIVCIVICIYYFLIQKDIIR